MSDLSNAEYLATQQRIELLCRLILETDPDVLSSFIQQAEHADTVGAVLDPTAWIRGHDRLRVVIGHAQAVASARRFIVAAGGVGEAVAS